MIDSTKNSLILKKFGLLIGTLFILLAMFHSRLYFSGVVGFLWGILALFGVFLIIISLIRPQLLDPFYIKWMWFGEKIGSVVSRIILTIIFYFVVFPTSLLWRAFHKDPFMLRWNSGESYFLKKTIERPQDMKRLF